MRRRLSPRVQALASELGRLDADREDAAERGGLAALRAAASTDPADVGWHLEAADEADYETRLLDAGIADGEARLDAEIDRPRWRRR